jgi:hypothetical protein
VTKLSAAPVPIVSKLSVSPTKPKVKKTPSKVGPSYLKGTKSSQTKGAIIMKLKEQLSISPL